MKMYKTRPLVKLPHAIDLTLYLIREELKSEKLFHGLHQAGFDDCFYQPRLGTVILANMGLDDGSDSTIEFYCTLIGKRSKKIDADNESVMKQAFKVYMELMMEKKRRLASQQSMP